MMRRYFPKHNIVTVVTIVTTEYQRLWFVIIMDRASLREEQSPLAVMTPERILKPDQIGEDVFVGLIVTCLIGFPLPRSRAIAVEPEE
jgi:hypothetical protein